MSDYIRRLDDNGENVISIAEFNAIPRREPQKAKRLGIDLAIPGSDRSAYTVFEIDDDWNIIETRVAPRSFARPRRNWWPLVGWLLVAAVGVSAWTWLIWWLTR